ncbi:tyrosyl-tRNA synthetase [Candidatus Carsonella ruddii HT isolate Thao2000]|uniref:tyrosine--tRNA ligase n=1 Tax=Candidatus Carsonella ruddii HT isolate Thao2000 TaxID=1202539 RepID=J3VQ98_CARRU|nr:hypothetical protein [Candidatus Carsonella ruddii]AFP84116.1 tyrosyl-tRNA synthetase [Candidatus Carsonella ruddii HT isolate Thao2000]
MNFFFYLFKKIIGKFNYSFNKIKLGIDPTYYSIHIGHLLLINFIFFLIKKKFILILIIGDFTTILKKNIEKKNLILNSICLKSQLINIIGEIFIFFNSIWINKNKILFFLKIFEILNINKFIKNNLKNKLKNKVNINNIIYPIFQAYDSLIINSNIEIGGIDQLLNCICGRFLQKIFKKNKQNSILIFILEKNNEKISKSNNDYFINNEKNIDINLLEKIFFNIKIYIINFKKKNIYFNFFFKKNKKNIIFKKKIFISVLYKKIFGFNKFLFNNFLYKKKIIINKKIVIKNFILKKHNYYLNNLKICLYD